MMVRSKMAGFTNHERRAPSALASTILTVPCLTFVVVLTFPASALAYVGPGAGALGTLWTVIMAIIFAILFIVGRLLVWSICTFLRLWNSSKPKEVVQAEHLRANNSLS
jgi:hypothetical protein